MGQTLQRRQALADYLAQIENQEAAGYPDVLRAGASALALDAWETAVLEKALSRTANGQTDWASLLLESVVVRGKYEDEVRALQSSDSLSDADIAGLENELITDAAVGLALVRETTKAIASMNIVGQKDDAHRLSGFLHKLGASVAEIRDRIGPDGYSNAEKLSREMLANAAANTPAAARGASGTKSGARHTPQPGNAERKRRTLLTAHLAQLELLMATEGQESAIENNAGASSLKLDAWEKAALSRALSDNPGSRRWVGLMAECVAFQAKYLAERDTPSENAKIQQTTNTALGLALLEELQREINGMIRESKFEDAKKLSTFRNKLSQTVKLLRDQINPQIFKTAETAAQNLVSPVEDVEPRKERPRGLSEAAATGPTTFRRKIAASRYVAADVEPSRALPLVIALTIALALWGIFVAPRYLSKKIPTLKNYEMPASPAFLEMTVRPPSLFIQVKSGVWDEMTDRERTDFVQAVADRAGPAGYTGAQFRSTEGYTVAQWLSETGVRLYKRPANPS